MKEGLKMMEEVSKGTKQVRREETSRKEGFENKRKD